MKNRKTEKKRRSKDQINKGAVNFIKYSGLAFQMGGIIFVTVWGGQKLDLLMENETPVFTIILSLLGVCGSIYIAIKDFINFNK